MTKQRTKTVPGYRVQPMLPIALVTFNGTCLDAVFTEHDGKPCVEVLVQMGLIKTPYTMVVTYAQALESDVIERVPATAPCRCEVCGGRADDPARIHGRR